MNESQLHICGSKCATGLMFAKAVAKAGELVDAAQADYDKERTALHLAARGPRQNNFDISLIKDTRIGDR